MASPTVISSYRICIAIMLCGLFIVKDIMSVNLSVALTCMVEPLSGGGDSHNKSANCKLIQQGKTADYGGNLSWTGNMQGLLYSAFDWGLMAMLFTGLIADRSNAKWLTFVSIFLAAFVSAITPVAANISYPFMVSLRAAIGFCDALAMPAVNSLITHWFPTDERNTVYAIATGGNQIGTLIIMPLAGWLCGLSRDATYGLGWPMIFYVSAGLGFLWSLAWLKLGRASPGENRGVKTKPQILQQPNIKRIKHQICHWRNIPWKDIIRSKAVWASVCGTLGHEFPLIMLIIFLPAYLQEVLQFDVHNNGLLSALPTACFFVTKILISFISDGIRKRSKINGTLLCKLWNSIAALGLGGFLLAATFLHCSNRYLAVLFFSLSHVFAGFHIPGSLITLIYIAPQYTGTVTGLAYFFVALSGICGPLMIRGIVQNGTREQWNIAFYIISAVAFLPLLIFNMFGSAEIQKWAKPKSDDSENESKVGMESATDLETM